MKKPNEFLSAIRNGQEIDWDNFLQVMGKNDIKPSTICKIFNQTSPFAKKTAIRIEDEEGCKSLEKQFPQSIDVIDRVAAAHAGDSHQVAVDGSLLILHKASWKQPQVAVSWDGLFWDPLPEPNLHIVIVENMQNFLRFHETILFIRTFCGLNVPEESILLIYGAGNAAVKPCNSEYYRHFASINCLFDIDKGGVKTYNSLKKLLAPVDIPLTFLTPKDISKRLENSRQWLNDDELRYIHAAKNKHPELESMLNHMYHSRKKLEQETYLEIQHG